MHLITALEAWDITLELLSPNRYSTVYAKKYAHGYCFVVVIHWQICLYPSGLLHWHCGNLTIAPVPAKQPWWLWINTSCEFIMNDCITTTKQSTTKPCAYFLGYTVITTGSDTRHITARHPVCFVFSTYSMSQEICTRYCCALLCCGYPYSSGLLCWHWGNR